MNLRTKMDSKAKKLLSKIAQRLPDKALHGDVRSVYNEAISSLPERHNNLKQFIEKNVDVYCKFFEMSCGKTKLTGEIILPKSLSKPSSSFIAELMMHQKDCPKLMQILDRTLKHDLKDVKTNVVVQKLCNIAISCNSTEVVHAVANALYSYFDDVVESTLKLPPNTDNTNQLQENIFKVSLFLHHQLQNRSFGKMLLSQELPNPTHIQAALFSLYIDLEIHVCQNHNRDSAKRLLNYSNLFLEGNTDLLLDSLSQVSQISNASAASLLEPIFKSVLLDHPWSKLHLSPQKYLQFILVIKKAISVLKSSHYGASNQHKTTALQVQAPDNFYKWIVSRTGGEDVLDTTPLTIDSAPSAITQYFIDEADVETVEDLIDLCHVAAVIVEEDKSDAKVTDELDNLTDDEPNDQPPLLPDSLFFIDTKPNSSTIRKNRGEVDDSELEDGSDISDTTSIEKTSEDEAEDVESNGIHSEQTDISEDVENILKPSQSTVENNNSVEDVVTKINTSSESQKKSVASEKKQTTSKKRKSTVRTRSTPRKQPKVTGKVPELTSIPEDELVEAECIRLELTLKKLTKRTKSDSESSTGSHGYSTRSKSKNA